ncbi:nucleoside-diphosphate sugar epimerase [Sediminicola arcticus]|jgi:nucleoside-diphosphate-sugar epimerase|uniref:Nucleoside-diphosphate sugar epimerase n=1 Tax=Sediminicola arcticus TaxID=1574308 RepID=A0ABV2SQH9_9FLAO
METKDKTAIILGATGLTGGFLLNILLGMNYYKKVIIFSRSTIGFTHPKLEENLIDLLTLEAHSEKFKADEVFCCIGTTKAKTPNKETYKKIDYGIPLSAAKLCKQNSIPTFIVISALGANANSGIFYNRIKGEMEEDVLKCTIPKAHILQPSLIGGKREEKRVGEWVFKQLFGLFNLLLVGPLQKYRSIAPKNIAKAMVWLANHDHDTIRIESDGIQKIAGK